MGAGHSDGGDEGLYRVSYHAVTRYVQRILEIEVEIDPKQIKPGKLQSVRIADAHCKAAGTDVRSVQRTILTPGVIFAIGFNVPLVSTHNFTCQIANGVVVTIHRRPRHSSNLPTKIMGRREARRDSARAHRRLAHS